MILLKKIVKTVIVIILVTVVIISVYVQIKFESYITKQKEDYYVLSDRERISYKPAIYYLLFKRKKLMRASQLVYQEYNVKIVYAARLYDGYIIDCYYNNDEIDNFLNSDSINTLAPN